MKEIIVEFLKVLDQPSALTALCLALLFAFLIYCIPVGGLIWLNYDGTNRIVGAISELRSDLKQAVIPRLAER